MKQEYSRLAVFALCACLGITCWLYLPGIHGIFLVDDYAAIVSNPAVHITDLSLEAILRAALSSQSGPLGRPLPMATFALDHLHGGLAPAPYKLTNILFHLITALLVFIVSRDLLAHASAQSRPCAQQHEDNSWLAPALIAALWALHPLHVSTVLYAVQRMTQLAMLFMLAALWAYLSARSRMLRGDSRGGWSRLVLLCLPMFVAAMLSKENAALLPLLLLVVEVTFFRFAMPQEMRLSRHLLIALLALPTLALLGYLVWNGAFPPALHAREFSPAQRMLLETHVLALYLYQLFWPDPANMPFYYDSIAGTPEAMARLHGYGMAVFWLLLLAAALFCLWRDNARLFAFAVLWFIGGHLLESTTILLELGFEHRNYLPAFGPAFAIGAILAGHRPNSHSHHRFRKLLLLAIPAVLAWQMHQRVMAWSSADAFFTHTLQNVPTSARAWADYSFDLSSRGELRAAVPPLIQAVALNPREAGYPMVALNLTINALHAEPDKGLLQEALRRLQQYPLTAYGHGILSTLINPLIDQTITPQGRLVLGQLLDAAIHNPTLRPEYREVVTLALLYLAKSPAPEQ